MKKILLALSTLFLLTVLGLLARESWQDRQQTLSEARRNLHNLTLTLEAQTGYGLKATDLLLTELSETVRQYQRLGVANAQGMNTLLARRLQFAANTSNLAYIDARGRVVYTARNQDRVANLNVADRAYFRAHRDNPDAGLYFDLPSTSRVDGGMFIALSKRVDGPDGDFAGVVVAIIAPGKLEAFYGTLDVGRQGTITLLREDGWVLVQSPPAERSHHMEPGLRALLQERLARENHGRLEFTTPRETILYGAYRKVDRFPLVLLVTLSSEEILADWYEDLWKKSLFGSGIFLVVLILTVLLLGQLQRQSDSEQQLRKQALVLEQMSDALVVTDLKGRVVDWNQAAEALFGHLRSQVLGRRPDFLLLPGQNDTLPRQIRYGLDNQGHWNGETPLRRNDGTLVECELTAVPLLDPDGRTMATITVLRDITERRRVEKLKSEFISTVSHELRTPLTSIRGSLELVTQGAAGLLPPKAGQLLIIALRNSQRLVELVNDLLDIQKVESGQLDFRLDPMDLVELVDQAMEANKIYAQTYGVHFERLAGTAGAPVRGDFARLMQVMTNLLSNAAKFSPEGGRVELSVSPRNDGYRVAVRDFGDGIPDSFRGRVFQRFAQADSSSTRRRPGTGLGLAIAKAIVERHQGTIGFDTGPRGTCFYFELPAAEAADLPRTVAV